jgi:hypothetical protein
VFAFDGQGGPWSIWNEGTAQYAAAGGPAAQEFLWELLAQQETDGSLASSTDEFSGGGVWTSRWHGIAPTAWLYFALDRWTFPGKKKRAVDQPIVEAAKKAPSV